MRRIETSIITPACGVLKAFAFLTGIAMFVTAACHLPGVKDFVDYQVTSPEFPADGLVATDYSGSFVIANVGTKSGSGIAIWSIFLSADAFYDGTDQLIQTGTQGMLAQGEISPAIGFMGTWPGIGGTYYLIIRISATEDANQINDEAVSAPIVVDQPQMADYDVAAALFPTEGRTGDSWHASFIISNVGSAAGAQTVNWNAYLSADAAYGVEDTQVGSGTIVVLAAGASSQSVGFSGTWPTTADTYYLIIRIAADDGNSANDQEVSAPITIALSFVDYDVISPVFPERGIVGSTFTASFVIGNVGNGDGALPIEWGVYWSTDAEYGTEDVLAQSGSLATFPAAGDSSSIDVSSTRPAVAGLYCLIMRIGATDDANGENDMEVSPQLAVFAQRLYLLDGTWRRVPAMEAFPGRIVSLAADDIGVQCALMDFGAITWWDATGWTTPFGIGLPEALSIAWIGGSMYIVDTVGQLHEKTGGVAGLPQMAGIVGLASDGGELYALTAAAVYNLVSGKWAQCTEVVPDGAISLAVYGNTRYVLTRSSGLFRYDNGWHFDGVIQPPVGGAIMSGTGETLYLITEETN